MSFDFGSIDFEAGDIASDIDVDPGSADYGAETLADSSDQVGDFAGNSEFVTATDAGSITDAPTSISGDEFVGPPAPSSFDTAVSGLKDSAASARTWSAFGQKKQASILNRRHAANAWVADIRAVL